MKKKKPMELSRQVLADFQELKRQYPNDSDRVKEEIIKKYPFVSDKIPSFRKTKKEIDLPNYKRQIWNFTTLFSIWEILNNKECQRLREIISFKNFMTKKNLSDKLFKEWLCISEAQSLGLPILSYKQAPEQVRISVDEVDKRTTTIIEYFRQILKDWPSFVFSSLQRDPPIAPKDKDIRRVFTWIVDVFKNDAKYFISDYKKYLQPNTKKAKYERSYQIVGRYIAGEKLKDIYPKGGDNKFYTDHYPQGIIYLLYMMFDTLTVNLRRSLHLEDKKRERTEKIIGLLSDLSDNMAFDILQVVAKEKNILDRFDTRSPLEKALLK